MLPAAVFTVERLAARLWVRRVAGLPVRRPALQTAGTPEVVADVGELFSTASRGAHCGLPALAFP